MTLIERLKNEMARQKLTAMDLAKKANLRPSFIYDVLNGKSSNPSTIRLAQVADALGISLDELMGRQHEFPQSHDDSKFVAVSSILVAASAGGGTTVATEEHGEPYYFRRSWVRDRLQAKPDDLRLIFIQGDSMEPTLNHGDMILVDISRRSPSPPGIFVLFDGLGLVAKRLEYLSASNPPAVRISSDNPQYPPYERLVEELEIIGRVVWFAREM